MLVKHKECWYNVTVPFQTHFKVCKKFSAMINMIYIIINGFPTEKVKKKGGAGSTSTHSSSLGNSFISLCCLLAC